MGIGPEGVCPWNGSVESSPPVPFSSDTIQSRSLPILADPDGRWPKETLRFVRAKADAARKSEAHADSDAKRTRPKQPMQANMRYLGHLRNENCTTPEGCSNITVPPKLRLNFMQSVGNFIHAARLKNGLSLEEISARTRISLRTLQAIEEDDIS